MNTGDYMQVKISWDIPTASAPVLSIWNFVCDSVTEPSVLQVVGEDIVDAFVDRYLTPMSGYNPTNVSVSGIELRKYGSLLEMYTKIGVLYTGSGGSSMLPPFVTYNMELIRFDPSVRNGHISWPAPSLNTCLADGTLNLSTKAAIDAVGEAWSSSEFVVEGPDYVFTHVIARLNAGLLNVPTHAVPVAGYACRGYGSQNTRK